MRNRICFVTTGDIKNIATAKRALGLANPLVELGWNVSILMEDTEENRHRVQMECCGKVTVCYFPHCSALQELKEKNKLISKIQPDFVYLCAFVVRNIVKASKSTIIITEHSELPSLATSRKKVFKVLLYYFEEFFSIFYSDGILNASKYLQKTFTRRARYLFNGKKKMLYFPYAYSSEMLPTKVEPIEDLSVEVDKESICFTYLGSLSKAYGTIKLLKAFHLLLEKHKNARLLLLGKGDEFVRITEYVKKYNLDKYVLVSGYVAEEDIPKYFSITDYFVMPMNDTIQDKARCPSKLYMYLPYKKPIITCRIGEPYEVLKENGLYYSVGDENSLFTIMKEACVKGRKEVNINPLLHEWKSRAIEFNNWINKYFR